MVVIPNVEETIDLLLSSPSLTYRSTLTCTPTHIDEEGRDETPNASVMGVDGW